MRAFIRPDKRTERLMRNGTLNVRHLVRPKRRNIGLGTPVRRFGKSNLYYVCARSTGEYPFSVSRARRISGLDAKQLTFTALKCNIENEGYSMSPRQGGKEEQCLTEYPAKVQRLSVQRAAI